MNGNVDTRGAAAKARDLLSGETPLSRDCGRLCARACCQGQGDGPCGMLLFPGEEAMYDPLPQGFALHRDARLPGGAALLTCEGACDRDTRPLACRVFPLAFACGGEGEVRIDPRAFALCPLAPSGVEGLRPGFVSAAREAARALLAESDTRACVLAQEEYIRALTRPLWGEAAV